MNEQQQQFLNLYHTFRHEEQVGYYKARSGEFENAQKQGVYMAAGLMFLTAIVSLLISANLIGAKSVLAALGVILPALSAALTSYNSLYSFEQQSKLYKDAMNALHKAEASRLDAEQATEAETVAKMEDYVNQVEGVFQKEQGQWGQLISEIKSLDALKPKAPAK